MSTGRRVLRHRAFVQPHQLPVRLHVRRGDRERRLAGRAVAAAEGGVARAVRAAVGARLLGPVTTLYSQSFQQLVKPTLQMFIEYP